MTELAFEVRQAPRALPRQNPAKTGTLTEERGGIVYS
jgi:hypothetical protein